MLIIAIVLKTFAETERRHWECKENEWEREKQKILNALLGSGQDTVDFQPETEVRETTCDTLMFMNQWSWNRQII